MLHKGVYIDEWTLLEKVFLASAVFRLGDRNWVAVCEMLKPRLQNMHPDDWFTPQTCAAQYDLMVKDLADPKDQSLSSVLQVVKQLKLICKKSVPPPAERWKKYYLHKQRLKELQSGNIDRDTLRSYYNEARYEHLEQEQKLKEYKEFLKKRAVLKFQYEKYGGPLISHGVETEPLTKIPVSSILNNTKNVQENNTELVIIDQNYADTSFDDAPSSPSFGILTEDLQFEGVDSVKSETDEFIEEEFVNSNLETEHSMVLNTDSTSVSNGEQEMNENISVTSECVYSDSAIDEYARSDTETKTLGNAYNSDQEESDERIELIEASISDTNTDSSDSNDSIENVDMDSMEGSVEMITSFDDNSQMSTVTRGTLSVDNADTDDSQDDVEICKEQSSEESQDTSELVEEQNTSFIQIYDEDTPIILSDVHNGASVILHGISEDSIEDSYDVYESFEEDPESVKEYDIIEQPLNVPIHNEQSVVEEVNESNEVSEDDTTSIAEQQFLEETIISENKEDTSLNLNTNENEIENKDSIGFEMDKLDSYKSELVKSPSCDESISGNFEVINEIAVTDPHEYDVTDQMKVKEQVEDVNNTVYKDQSALEDANDFTEVDCKDAEGSAINILVNAEIGVLLQEHIPPESVNISKTVEDDQSLIPVIDDNESLLSFISESVMTSGGENKDVLKNSTDLSVTQQMIAGNTECDLSVVKNAVTEIINTVIDDTKLEESVSIIFNQTDNKSLNTNENEIENKDSIGSEMDKLDSYKSELVKSPSCDESISGNFEVINEIAATEPHEYDVTDQMQVKEQMEDVNNTVYKDQSALEDANDFTEVDCKDAEGSAINILVNAEIGVLLQEHIPPESVNISKTVEDDQSLIPVIDDNESLLSFISESVMTSGGENKDVLKNSTDLSVTQQMIAENTECDLSVIKNAVTEIINTVIDDTKLEESVSILFNQTDNKSPTSLADVNKLSVSNSDGDGAIQPQESPDFSSTRVNEFKAYDHKVSTLMQENNQSGNKIVDRDSEETSIQLQDNANSLLTTSSEIYESTTEIVSAIVPDTYITIEKEESTIVPDTFNITIEKEESTIVPDTFNITIEKEKPTIVPDTFNITIEKEESTIVPDTFNITIEKEVSTMEKEVSMIMPNASSIEKELNNSILNKGNKRKTKLYGREKSAIKSHLKVSPKKYVVEESAISDEITNKQSDSKCEYVKQISEEKLTISENMKEENNKESVKPTIVESMKKDNKESVKPTIVESMKEENKESVKPTILESMKEENNKESAKPTILESMKEENNEESVKPTILERMKEENNKESIISQPSIVENMKEEKNKEPITEPPFKPKRKYKKKHGKTVIKRPATSTINIPAKKICFRGKLKDKSDLNETDPMFALSTPVSSKPMKVIPSSKDSKMIWLTYSTLTSCKYAHTFRNPITDKIVPGYSNLIYSPMDLLTMKKKFDAGHIQTMLEFQKYVLLMLTNAKIYNRTTSQIYNMALDSEEVVLNHIKMVVETTGSGLLQKHLSVEDAKEGTSSSLIDSIPQSDMSGFPKRVTRSSLTIRPTKKLKFT